jgi:hypothetical protein
VHLPSPFMFASVVPLRGFGADRDSEPAFRRRGGDVAPPDQPISSPRHRMEEVL